MCVLLCLVAFILRKYADWKIAQEPTEKLDEEISFIVNHEKSIAVKGKQNFPVTITVKRTFVPKENAQKASSLTKNVKSASTSCSPSPKNKSPITSKKPV